jgi:hypothetical protein
MSAFCILYSTANGVGEVKISVGLLLIRFALIKAIDCGRLKSLVIRISLHEKRNFIETPELGVNSYVVKPLNRFSITRRARLGTATSFRQRRCRPVHHPTRELLLPMPRGVIGELLGGTIQTERLLAPV